MELNKIYNQDCLTGIKQIPDSSIDMVFCDYPFNIQDGRDDYVKFVDDLSKEIYRVLKPNCVFLIVNNPANIYKTRNCYDQFTHRDTVVLVKKGAIRPAKHFGFMHNVMMTFIKGTDTGHKWNGTRINHDKNFPTDVMEYQNGYIAKGGYQHLQAMPLDLVQRMVEIYSNAGDTVLDPFMGAGTTAVACKRTGRNYVGFELKKKYYDLINDRLEKENTLFTQGE
jgi:site-specific DNA-methyltransferase (adenine-specific)